MSVWIQFQEKQPLCTDFPIVTYSFKTGSLSAHKAWNCGLVTWQDGVWKSLELPKTPVPACNAGFILIFHKLVDN